MSSLSVVDSSVVHKWLSALGERHVDEAMDLLHRHVAGKVTLVAPSLMPTEVANGLRWKPTLAASDVTALMEYLDTLDVALFDVTYERLAVATELAYRHKLTVYDALFLALAEELDCPLVTADKRAFAGIDTPVEMRLL